jgi:catalase
MKVNRRARDKDNQKEESPIEGGRMTTNTGMPVSDNQNTLSAGVRGPSLIEDHAFREKMTQFDHERIPERVVHARGSAAHGVFRVYDASLERYTMARFLTDPSLETPVFVRFSTVVGFRGSADTVRDVRGFATRFYTPDGNYDLVGNNMPVFFIQDAMKFPDLVHALKPGPHHEMPQASAAHNGAWDFISLTPESMHMIMWVMSDRALPRSYAMMEGFGVHTFRLVNADGQSTFCKFFWKPALGVHSLVWDETQKIAGKDPDFNRRDLWEAIEMGNFPEYELGLQLLAENEVGRLGPNVDILDPTKIWPEDVVPVQRVGRMVLNRNPENFFEETEQAAYHPGHLVPGIDLTNDPLLQGRMFSYLDTQLNRFGTPNFSQLPINRPQKGEVRNFNQDGFMRYSNPRGVANYEPNSRGVQYHESSREEGGFVSYPEEMSGPKIRARAESFGDHFTQARLFWNSMSTPEKEHIVEAFRFELGKVTLQPVKERMLQLIANVDAQLAELVANALGLPAPKPDIVNDHSRRAPGLSQMEGLPAPVKGRMVAVLAAEGVNLQELSQMARALEKEGVEAEIVAPHGGYLKGNNGGEPVQVDKTFLTADSVLFDAVWIPGGADSVEALRMNGEALHFVREAYKHCKPVCATREGVRLLEAAGRQRHGELISVSLLLEPFGSKSP